MLWMSSLPAMMSRSSYAKSLSTLLAKASAAASAASQEAERRLVVPDVHSFISHGSIPGDCRGPRGLRGNARPRQMLNETARWAPPIGRRDRKTGPSYRRGVSPPFHGRGRGPVRLHFRMNQIAETPVPPPDLLPLRVRATVVADRQFVDPGAGLGQPCRNLRLDPEAVHGERKRPKEIGANHLLTRLHVRQIEIRQRVAEQGEEPVPERVPEEEDAAGPSHEARPVDGVGPAIQDGVEKGRDRTRVVLQVRVLDDHHVAGGMLESGAQCGPPSHGCVHA